MKKLVAFLFAVLSFVVVNAQSSSVPNKEYYMAKKTLYLYNAIGLPIRKIEPGIFFSIDPKDNIIDETLFIKDEISKELLEINNITASFLGNDDKISHRYLKKSVTNVIKKTNYITTLINYSQRSNNNIAINTAMNNIIGNNTTLGLYRKTDFLIKKDEVLSKLRQFTSVINTELKTIINNVSTINSNISNKLSIGTNVTQINITGNQKPISNFEYFPTGSTIPNVLPNDYGRSFYILSKDSASEIKKIEFVSRLLYGGFILPFKFRPVSTSTNSRLINSDVVPNVSGLINVGYRMFGFGRNRLLETNGFYLGGFAGGFNLPSDSKTSSTSVFGASYGASVTLILYQRASMIFCYGFDQTNTGVEWEYNGRDWFGFGLGITFSTSESNPSSNQP